MIKEYKTMYPIRLVVSVGIDAKELSNRYLFVNDVESWEYSKFSELECGEFFCRNAATTVPVVKKSTGDKCILICLSSGVHSDIGIVCHEASHVSDMICDLLGITYGSYVTGEAHAYICGWVGECVSKSIELCLKNKYRNDKGK